MESYTRGRGRQASDTQKVRLQWLGGHSCNRKRGFKRAIPGTGLTTTVLRKGGLDGDNACRLEFPCLFRKASFLSTRMSKTREITEKI